jgi:hypothetical protein
MMQTVTPLPMIGDVVRGRDVVGRELRISGHPDSDRVVLSIWQDGRCQATVRLSRADIPGVTKALVAGLVPVPQPRGSETTSRPRPAAATGAGSLREVTDRIATTVAARLRRFTSGH